VNVRPRTAGDLGACERLAREVHRADGYPPRRAGDLHGFVAAAGALGAWVAESHGDVVGHVALQPRSSPAVMALAGGATGLPAERLAVVARLLVAPAHRGVGIGGALLACATAASVGHDRRPILDVAVHFDAAIRLYERAGWTCAGRVTVTFAGEEPLDELVYVGPAVSSNLA
jgi:GNAT superfamily N-acetyltransferase